MLHFRPTVCFNCDEPLTQQYDDYLTALLSHIRGAYDRKEYSPFMRKDYLQK